MLLWFNSLKLLLGLKWVFFGLCQCLVFDFLIYMGIRVNSTEPTMKVGEKNNLHLMLLCSLLFAGHSNQAFSFDYSATTKCLVEPQTAQYGGGIIVNPKFDHSIDGWTMFGQGAIEKRISEKGNSFIVVHSRKQPLDSFSQKVQLEKGKLYAFSAWVQISEGSETVAAVFRMNSGELIPGGTVIAEHRCWSMLKGGIVANFSGPVDILFESKNTTVEIWADNVSLQPFTKKQWRSHQDKSIEKVRKSKVRFQVIHSNKTAIKGARISIKQTTSGFPFGCSMNKYILEIPAYQNWFTSRFKVTAFTNEMKWYSTEKVQGQENYTISDAMVKFTKQNGISIRGHNILWDNNKTQPKWVNNLSPEELQQAAVKRINSVVSRYSGQLIGWDVVNENLHFTFFEDKLGKNASASFYSTTYQLDPNTTMFMNEFSTIENSRDNPAAPYKYVKKLNEIQSFPGNAGLLTGVGLQSRFGSGQPNLPYMRASLDILGATKSPLWLTEAHMAKGPNQTQYLEEILREGYSHPAVQGIVIWPDTPIHGCFSMCTTDENFTNTPIGDVVDKLLREWTSETLEITANSNGSFETSLFHGDYDLTAIHPVINSSTTLSFKVAANIPQETVHVQIHA